MADTPDSAQDQNQGDQKPIPDQLPCAGGRYRRLPDGSLEPIEDEE
jgi:hypothetical protein